MKLERVIVPTPFGGILQPTEAEIDRLSDAITVLRRHRDFLEECRQDWIMSAPSDTIYVEEIDALNVVLMELVGTQPIISLS